MTSFFLPVGKAAGAALPTFLSVIACGASLPVSDLDILHISDAEENPVLPALVQDLNEARRLFASSARMPFFSSSLQYEFLRPVLPTLSAFSRDGASSALLDALRGKGIPLSYRTDAEAVDWAFSFLLSGRDASSLSPLDRFIARISAAGGDSDVRISILCDLCDPWSAGVTFALIRHLRRVLASRRHTLLLFCLAKRSAPPAVPENDTLSAALRSMAEQQLVSGPDSRRGCPVHAAWLFSLPASLARSEESWRVVWTSAARRFAQALSAEKLPDSGLHSVELPSVLTLQSFGDEAKSLAAFLHGAAWLLSDLLPALRSYLDRPPALLSLAPNTRNGLFRRLFRSEEDAGKAASALPVLIRTLTALLLDVLALIRGLPDSLRLAEVSDPLWDRAVDACGRTVTIASEYDVSLLETEEAGVMDIKPVHRVSLADTEEERQLRRLEEISAQLKEETGKRDAVFASLGACRAMLVLRDCRRKCSDALQRAEKQLNALMQEPSAEHLAIAALARRVRLLQAAVARCDQDLADRELLSRLSEPSPDARQEELPPFAGQLLAPAAAEKLFALISADDSSVENARKEVRSQLPALLYGAGLSDGKTLLRELLSACKPADGQDPLSALVASVFSVSAEEVASLRFLSAGKIPPVPLLPDLYPADPPVTVSALLPLLPSNDAQRNPDAEKRGLLALLLLRQYRRRNSREAALSVQSFTSGDSPVLLSWLSARRADRVSIVSLASEADSQPLALIIPGRDLLPARMTAAHAALIPSFAKPWFDEETNTFADPVSLLSEGDRSVLLEQLERIAGCLPEEDSALSSFLSAFLRDLRNHAAPFGLPDRLSLRLKAAFGLRMLPAYADVLVRDPVFYERFLPEDEIASLLADQPSVPASACAVPDDILYLYRGIPFARENSHTLLEGIPIPAENWILSVLEQESDTLFRASDDYRDALVSQLSLLLERFPSASPEARQAALDLLEKAEHPVDDAVVDLTWPWDPESPSVRTILTESLGSTLAEPASRPFSDLLTLFPTRGNEVLGDSLLSGMCVLPPAPVPDADPSAPVPQSDSVLPPLDAAFTSALCCVPEGRTLVRPGFLSFERAGENAVRAVLTLEGSFPLRLIRVYGEEELLRLYAHDIPTLALWPDLPLAPEDWHAYYTYASLSQTLRLTVCSSDDPPAVSSEASGRFVHRSSTFPYAFAFHHGDRSAGAVPNLLPQPDVRREDPVTACVDFGSVGTSVVLVSGRQRKPLQGNSLLRTLISNPALSRDLLRREFLPAVPVSALLPTASRLFRNVPGAAPLPLEDGIVLMSADLEDVLSIPSGSLYTCLKWEEEKGRSVSLCLHQIMLLTALQARVDGAETLDWRFAVPDEMAKAGRERLTDLFSSLAEQVSAESGLPFPEKKPHAAFAAESSCLGGYFRFCSPEDTRGGFMVLDLGACTADLSLFLRGREQAVRTLQIPLGVHYMLLPSLLSDPSLLRRDLAAVQDPLLQRDLALLEQVLQNARVDPSSLRHSRLALDNFIADHFPALIPALLWQPETGMPTRIGSVLLLYFSYLMMLAGLLLLQISADSGKNDFLPEQMSLCLSGRGSLLLEFLPDQFKTGLWHCLTMFRNRRVASISLLFSAEKKMEIPVGLSLLERVTPGLPDASAIPSAIPLRPEELLPQFLIRFCREFPVSGEVLFPGFFTGDFYHPFTPRGEAIVSSAISQSFTEQMSLRPFDALSAWIGTLLDLLNTPA